MGIISTFNVPNLSRLITFVGIISFLSQVLGCSETPLKEFFDNKILPKSKLTSFIVATDAQKGEANFEYSTNASAEKLLSEAISIGKQSIHIYRLDFQDHHSRQSYDELKNHPQILWFEENHITELTSLRKSPSRGGDASDLTSFDDLALTYEQETFTEALWLKKIKLPEAFLALHDKMPKERPIIAVLDSGVDIEHPLLEDNIFDREALDQLSKAESVRTPLPLTTKAFGTSCKPSEFELCMHGTHVAGIIAASARLGQGGICPHCLILPIKVVEEDGDYEGSILDSSIITALTEIKRLRENGVKIRLANASFGKYRRSQTVSFLIHELSKGNDGVLFVAAAGNENSDLAQYPGSLDEVLAVANVDSVTAKKHQSSNFGAFIDIAAPGSGPCGTFDEGIMSIAPGNDLYCATGTSFAAPMVTGVAGLLLSVEPDLSALELKRRILASADPVIYQAGVNERGYRNSLGAGLLDAHAALTQKYSKESLWQKEERIKSGCGYIQKETRTTNDGFIEGIVFLLLPLLVILLPLLTKVKGGYQPRK